MSRPGFDEAETRARSPPAVEVDDPELKKLGYKELAQRGLRIGEAGLEVNHEVLRELRAIRAILERAFPAKPGD